MKSVDKKLYAHRILDLLLIYIEEPKECGN
jgi:hypothetical protein